MTFFIAAERPSSSVMVYTYSFLKLDLMYLSIIFPLLDINRKNNKVTRSSENVGKSKSINGTKPPPNRVIKPM
jgi:hypothetical protein